MFQRIAKPFRISIHALLAESDLPRDCRIQPLVYFYPRSPCGERPITCCPHMRHAVFLSTLSLRRATTILIALLTPLTRFLSTLSLRRATECTSLAPKPKTFLSTLSLRRATPPAPPRREFYKISIHALLAESD